MADPAPAVRCVYKPRRPQASPLFRLVSDHLQRLRIVYDDRFARAYGPWRPVVAQVADKFLACGVLDHGFARIRCDACAHEYLLAFSAMAVTYRSDKSEGPTAGTDYPGARSPPSTRAPSAPGARRRATAAHRTP